MNYFPLLSSVLLSFISCTSNGQAKQVVTTATVKKETPKLSNSLAQAYYYPNKLVLQQVDAIYDSLSQEQRAAQLIMIASSESLGFPYASYVKPKVDKGIAGNVIFLKGSKAAFTQQEQYLSKKSSDKLLPIYACDCEPSLFHYKFTDQKKMTPTSKLDDSLAIVQSLDSIHKVMKDINISINFAPVTDIAANKSIINNRAWSSQADSLIRLSNLFINQEQNDGIASTIKHFPGHGAVEGDTHHSKVWINGAMTEVDNFRKIIKASAPIFVMVGHISIKNNPQGYNTPNGNPASISRNIVTDLLKKDIGFKGIVTTDAMNMGAIKNIPNADFEALKAGVDLILMPNNPDKLHGQIVAALKQNDALAQQLAASVKKMILLKLLTDRVLD